MVELVAEQGKEINSLKVAITRMEAVIESVHEVQKDLKDHMLRQTDASNKIAVLLERMERNEKDIIDLAKTKEECVKNGCPKANEALESANWSKTFIVGALKALGAIVALAIVAGVIKQN